MRRIAFFTIILTLFLLGPVFSDEKIKIAIIDLKAEGISETTARTASEMIRTELVNTGFYDIVERAQMNQILQEQGFQQTGCTDQDCAVKLGRLISAHKIMIGTIGYLGGVIVLNVRIVDVEKGLAEYAAMAKALSEASLDETAGDVVSDLAEKISHKRWKSQSRKGAVSSEVYRTSTVNGYSALMPTYLTPLGKFSEILKPGYGLLFGSYFTDYSIGIEIGMWRSDGQKDVAESALFSSWCPVFIYPIAITDWLSFTPLASIGVTMYSVDFKDDDVALKHGSLVFEPLIMAGVSLDAWLAHKYGLNCGARYGMIYETGGPMHFMQFTAGFSYKY